MTRQSPEEELKKKLWSILYPDFPEGIELAKYEIRIDQVMQAISIYTERRALKRAIEELRSIDEYLKEKKLCELDAYKLAYYGKDHMPKLKAELEKVEEEG